MKATRSSIIYARVTPVESRPQEQCGRREIGLDDLRPGHRHERYKLQQRVSAVPGYCQLQ